jgi:uncharacterized membrane protein
MSRHNDPVSDPALFSATITPHRSLGRSGFLAVMIAVGGLSFVAGLVFLALGAWPVLGFLGLDVLLVFFAFRANYRSAAAYEQILVTASELRVRKVGHRGETAEWTFNPLWARLERESDPEYGLSKLFLVSRGRRLAIADFLAPREKEGFARALLTALGEARRGPTRTILT